MREKIGIEFFFYCIILCVVASCCLSLISIYFFFIFWIVIWIFKIWSQESRENERPDKSNYFSSWFSLFYEFILFISSFISITLLIFIQFLFFHSFFLHIFVMPFRHTNLNVYYVCFVNISLKVKRVRAEAKKTNTLP